MRCIRGCPIAGSLGLKVKGSWPPQGVNCTASTDLEVSRWAGALPPWCMPTGLSSTTTPSCAVPVQHRLSRSSGGNTASSLGSFSPAKFHARVLPRCWRAVKKCIELAGGTLGLARDVYIAHEGIPSQRGADGLVFFSQCMMLPQCEQALGSTCSPAFHCWTSWATTR